MHTLHHNGQVYTLFLLFGPPKLKIDNVVKYRYSASICFKKFMLIKFQI
jgi:hypothetical protein